MQSNKAVTDLRIEDFTYDLPPSRIAFYPLEQRDQSKLLVTRSNEITESVFGEIPGFLPQGSLMVLNNTKVVQARLEFFKGTGARIEIFCLQPVSPVHDVHLALSQPSPVSWQCLVGNAKKWKSGELEINDPATGLKLKATRGSKSAQEFEITFSWEPTHLSFGEVLEMAGKTPLPPYITRQAEHKDRTTYQTVFANSEGSVAAPTAGLHFTPGIFEKLEKKDISARFVTLHVGAGTFKPVSSATIGGHQMHSEQFLVERSLLETLASHLGAVISVGTTSMRTLESIYWLGLKFLNGYNPSENLVSVDQWEPYQNNRDISEKEAFDAILKWMRENNLDSVQGETALIIVPGYEFRVVDVLVTNFHQPKSTLLLLVAAFAGDVWKTTYQHALDNDFRFLSYGDSCLFFRNKGAWSMEHGAWKEDQKAGSMEHGAWKKEQGAWSMEHGKKSMEHGKWGGSETDIFGLAFRDYLEGDRWAMLKVHTDISEQEDLAVAYFFRDYEQLPEWEKMALDLCKGKVLDVGAGAGSHALILQQRGIDVTALDISKGAAEVMKLRKVNKVVCNDFFDYKEPGYDFLLFLMNGAGIAQTLPNMKNLLLHSRSLLKPGGSIILESTDLMYMFEDEDGAYSIPMNDHYYGEIEYQIEYRGVKGKPFPWLFADFDSMAEIAVDCGFQVELLLRAENHNYLSKLTLEK